MDCPICGAQITESVATCEACGQDARFTVRAPAGTEYGPYTLADIRTYSRQGRVDPAAALVAADGTARNLTEMGLTPLLPPVASAPARPSGSGMSTGAICGVVAVIVLVVLALIGGLGWAILYPVFGKAREKARQSSCLANIKQLSLATLMYASDYDEILPAAAGWDTLTMPYCRNAAIYQCPSSNLGPQSYDFSPAVGGLKIATFTHPAREAAIYDAGLPAGNGPHNSGGNVGYVDGHAKWSTNQSFAQEHGAAVSGTASP